MTDTMSDSVTAAANTAVPTSAAGRPPARRLHPATLLLITGSVLLLSAAVVFTIREWEQLGLGGQALVLGLSTVAAGVGAVAAWRHRLRATGEALASVTAGLVVLDAAGARVHGLAGVGDLPLTAYLTLAAGVIGAVSAVTAAVTGHSGRRLVAAEVTACGAVALGAVATVAWITELIRPMALPAVSGAAAQTLVGVLDGLLVVGAALVVAGRWGRSGPGTAAITTTARLTGTAFLALLGALVVAATGALLVTPVDAADATAVVPRLVAAGLAGLALAAWPSGPSGSRSTSSLALLAATGAWVALGGAVAAVAGALDAAPELRHLAPVALVAVAAGTLPSSRRVTTARDAAGWLLVAAGAVAAVVIAAMSLDRLAAMAAAAGAGEAVAVDLMAARGIATAALVAAVSLVAARALPDVRDVVMWTAPAVVTVAVPSLVWTLSAPPPLVAAAMGGAAAGVVAVLATASWVGRRRLPAVAVPAAGAWVAAWWLGGFAAAAGDSSSFGALLALSGMTALACAVLTRRARPSAGTVAVTDGVAGAAIAVTTLGLWLAGGDLRPGALLALAASAAASWTLVTVTTWPLARITAFVAGGVAAGGLLLSDETRDPSLAAVVAAGLLAHAVAGSLAVRDRPPFLPAVVRHAALPGTAAWLAVELRALAGPVDVPGVDGTALPAVAVLAVAALHLTWLLGPRSVALAGRPRVLVRDLLLPTTLALLAASVIAALLPTIAPLPLYGPMVPLLAVLVAVAVNASLVLRRSDPAQPVPLVWVRDVVLRVTESLAALVAVHALQPLTGLPVEYEVAVVAALTLAAHAVRTAVARARGRLAPGVTVYDLVTASSAAALGVLGLVAGESPLWVSGSTWLLNGAWGLVVAVLVRGPLAGPFPGRAVARGWVAVRTGAATGTIGYLLMLTATDRVVVDAVTVPVGALLVAFGVWAMLASHPGERPASSMRTLGPGLVVLLGPGAVLAVVDPGGWRPVLVAALATAVALAGAVLRWRAPLLAGVTVAVVVAVVQASPVAAAVDGWVWLAVGGVVTLGLGATFEDQLHRARAAGRALAAMR